MPRRQPKPPGRIRSSIVLRLNLRLFLRLLGVHIGTGLLLLCLALGGLLLWSHRQCLDVAELVEQRGPVGYGKAVARVEGKIAAQAEITFVIQ